MNQPTSTCLREFRQVACKSHDVHARHHLPPSSRVLDAGALAAQPASDQMDFSIDEPCPSNEWITDGDDCQPHDIRREKPSQAGANNIENYPGASKTFGQGSSFMDIFHSDPYSASRKSSPYFPFKSKDEWELAFFLVSAGLSCSAIDDFLQLRFVSDFTQNLTGFDLVC